MNSDKQAESLPNPLDILNRYTTVENEMDNKCAIENLRNNNGEIKDEPDSYLDDKVYKYKPVISVGYIKQEPYDLEDQPENIPSHSDIKEEITEDPTVVVQETGPRIDIKENYLTCCDECGEKYDLYCLNCPMLIRIFDSNNPNSKDNRVSRTLPKSFIDICETAAGVRVVALRPIPKGVVFGSFKGLNSSKDGAVSKWKLKNKELAYTKDPKRLNWMQYIRRGDRTSHVNLTSFQYENELYYYSDCHISVGDELLVCWDSASEDSTIQYMEEGYWKPQVCERLEDTYACTLCCVGYTSICYLTAHNFGCPEKRNQKDFCKEIIQCAFCKIYVDEKEYLDYHMDLCCERNTKRYVAVPCSPEDTDEPQLKDKYGCSMCEYSTLQKDKFERHQLTHTDVRTYKCPECPHRTATKQCLQTHQRTHANSGRTRFECELCGERFTSTYFFVVHQKRKHSVSVYKCDKCVFEATNAQNLRRHLATHAVAKRYNCETCDKQFRSNERLEAHVRSYHTADKKEYECPKCDYKSSHKGSFKKHLLTVHSDVQRFKCSRCPFRTSYKSTLEIHLRYHDTKPTETAEEKEYRCRKCEYRTHRKCHLNRHVASVHDGLKPFACTLCTHKATTKSNLKQHIAAMHSDDRPFKCDVCPQTFKEKYSCAKHIRYIHSEVGKTKYACSECEYRAHRKSVLNQHVASAHDGPKPFPCTLCPYKTASSFNLKQHVTVTHSDDKPFKCDMCPKTFKRNGSLAEHARNIHWVTEERQIERKNKYKCPHCPFGTNYKVSFEHHVNVHNKTELFRCSKCDYSTYHKNTFNKHRSRHERNEKNGDVDTRCKLDI